MAAVARRSWPAGRRGAGLRCPRTAGSLPGRLPPLSPMPIATRPFPTSTVMRPTTTTVNYFVLFDQLEWEAIPEETASVGTPRAGSGAIAIDSGSVPRASARATASTTRSRSLLRTPVRALVGCAGGGRAGLRAGAGADVGGGGVQGLAPYWFNVEATAYVGANGRNHYRFETEYEVLLTNRVVLQPMAELEIYGKPDLEHERDRGLATLDFGFRLRYLIRRSWRRMSASCGTRNTWVPPTSRGPTGRGPAGHTLSRLAILALGVQGSRVQGSRLDAACQRSA